MQAKPRIPKLCRQKKPNGKHLAYVELPGVGRRYCGPSESVKAQEEYDRLIAEWLANNRSLPATGVHATRRILIGGIRINCATQHRRCWNVSTASRLRK